jgi:hypothetical protein
VKHIPDHGYLYEVEIQNVRRFNSQECSTTEADALAAAAHVALYNLLIQGIGDGHITAGPSQLRQVNQSMLAQVPRPPGQLAPKPSNPPLLSRAEAPKVAQGTGPRQYNLAQVPRPARHLATRSSNPPLFSRIEAPQVAQGPGPRPVKESILAQAPRQPRHFATRSTNLPFLHRVEAPRIKKKRKKKQPTQQAQNSNLIPLTNRKVDDIDVPEPEGDRKWTIRSDQLKAEIRSVQSHQDRLKSNVLPAIQREDAVVFFFLHSYSLRTCLAYSNFFLSSVAFPPRGRD